MTSFPFHISPRGGTPGPAIHPDPSTHTGQLVQRPQGSLVCGDQAGLTAVLCVVTHLHVIGLVLRKLLPTHHGYLAFPGVAPKVSKMEKKIRNCQPPPLPQQYGITHMCTRSHTAARPLCDQWRRKHRTGVAVPGGKRVRTRET